MKTYITPLIAFVAAVILMTGTQGCYTQFSAAREEPVYEDQYSEQAAPADAEDGEAEEGEYVEQEVRPEADYGQDWSCQMRFGFDYYYPSTYWPSVGFTVAYNSPYYGWYDPWYSYGYPYYGYGYPYYGYGYPYYPYYDPWYGYPGYWYPTEVVPWQNREFGSTRGTGSTRGSGSSRGVQGVNASNGSRQSITDPLQQQQMDLPTASGRTVTGGTAAGTRSSGTSSATQSSRSKGSSRKDITRKVDKKLSPGQQGTRSSRDNKRLYRDRGSVSGSSRSKNSEGTPSVQSPQSGGASSRGTSTRPSGSSQPQRSSSPAVRSAPAPRSGGSAPSGGGGGARSGGGGGGGGARSGGGGGRR